MTRYLLVAALSIAVFGCDSTTSQNSDDIEDLFSANKALTESVVNRRNAYCIANPEYSKCPAWCSSPEANCGDGGPANEEVKADFQHTKISERLVSFSNTSENAQYYLWDFGDGSKSGVEEPTHSFAANGEYTVSLTATGSGVTDTHAKQISITDGVPTLPVASFSHSATALTVSFTGTSQNAVSSSWDFGDGSSSTETSPSHTYASAGSYDVALTVTNEDGSDTATESVTVTTSDPTPDPPVAVFSYSTNSLVVSFSNSSTNADSNEWDFGDGSSSTETAPSHSYASAGTYSVTLTVTNADGSDSESQNITVSDDVPPPPNDGSIWMAGHSYMRGIETMNDLGAELGEYRGGEGFLTTWLADAADAVNPARGYEHAGFIEWLQRDDQVAGSAAAASEIEQIVGYDIAVMVQWFQTEPSCTTHGLECGPAGQEHFNNLYSQMAAQAGVDLIPVGDAFVNAYNAGVTNLHTDGSHPSDQGQYLRNVTIYSYFSGIDARTMSSLGVASADVLKQAAYDALEGGSNPPPPPPPPPPPGGPDATPTDRTDLGGSGWNNDIPNPPPGIIVFTGYSNSSQSANTFLGQFAGTYNNYTFVNCAQGGSALENWVNNSMAASCSVSNSADVVLTVNMIATQTAMDAATSASTIASMLPQLDADLKAAFPNAIHAYYGGEPAHFVEPSKCPRICEPIRKLASDWAGAAALGVGSYLGPYLWAGDGIPNSHGFVYDINDYLDPSGGYANQHPSDAGRLKVSQQYDIWFRENGIN